MPTVVPSAFASVGAFDLEPMYYVFGPTGTVRPHSIEMETVFETSIRRSVLDSEQRAVMSARPRRRLPVVATGFTEHEQVELRAMASRMSDRRFVVPLHQDRSALTSPAPATTATLVCSTDDRRFFDGGRVVLFRAAAGRITLFEVLTVTTVNVGSLTLTSPVVGDFLVGDLVAPLIECDLLPNVGVSADWFRGSTMDLLAVETAGESALPGLEDAGVNPSGYGTFGGYPVLDIDPFRVKDGRDGSLARYSVVTGVGRGSNIPAVFGTRARMAEVCPVEFPDRSDAFDFLRFFDSRGGSAYPWWMMSPTMSYEPSAATTTSITVPQIGEEDDWDLRPYIGIRQVGGALAIRAVTGVVRGSGDDVVSFASVSGLSLATLERAAPAGLFRFADDVVDESWLSETLMRSEVRAIELPRDVVMTVTNFIRLPVTDLLGGYELGDCAVPPEFVCPFVPVAGGTFNDADDADFFLSDCSGGLSSSASKKPVAADGAALFELRKSPLIRSLGQKHHFNVAERYFTWDGTDIETFTVSFTAFCEFIGTAGGCDNEGELAISIDLDGGSKSLCISLCFHSTDTLFRVADDVVIALKRDPGDSTRLIIDTAASTAQGVLTNTGFSLFYDITASSGNDFYDETTISMDAWHVYSGEVGSSIGAASDRTFQFGFQDFEFCPVLFSGGP